MIENSMHTDILFTEYVKWLLYGKSLEKRTLAKVFNTHIVEISFATDPLPAMSSVDRHVDSWMSLTNHNHVPASNVSEYIMAAHHQHSKKQKFSAMNDEENVDQIITCWHSNCLEYMSYFYWFWDKNFTQIWLDPFVPSVGYFLQCRLQSIVGDDCSSL